RIEPSCESSLEELERRGYPVWRVPGGAAIDQVRSQMATDALEAGFEELMWIDSDTGFEADSVELLRAHDLPVVSGICVKKGQRALACHVLPGTEKFELGAGGGLEEILYAGTGFLHTRRYVYEDIVKQEKLPVCNERFGRTLVPYFLPLVVPGTDGTHWYLAEDYSFCERARRSGHAIHADTRFRLDHIGTYSYSWEDAGADKPRFASYTYRFN
ncbi:hypothetical protein, partial [Nocardia sp. NPDC003345]